jgi:nitroreductase
MRTSTQTRGIRLFNLLFLSFLSQCSFAFLTSTCGITSKLHPERMDSVSLYIQGSSFDDVVMSRYACTRFQRFDNRTESLEEAPQSNPEIVQQAAEALSIARRAPSGFNVQPYKVILVSSKQHKEAMARYCVGRNAHRVRDSDCTAVFLADRHVVKTFGDFTELLRGSSQDKKLGQKGLWKLKFYVTLFSSGFPFPKWISGPFSWAMRLAMRIVSWITRGYYPIPTLFSSETWSQKNTMLVAMTYLLGCTSRQIATCPMEGFTAWGIRKALKIPRRYTIPLIVATGSPYIRNTTTSVLSDEMTTDDAGISHGPPSTASSTPRFSMDQLVYGDVFGNSIDL